MEEEEEGSRAHRGNIGQVFFFFFPETTFLLFTVGNYVLKARLDFIIYTGALFMDGDFFPGLFLEFIVN